MLTIQGDQLVSMGRYGEAEAKYTQALEAQRRTLGDDHADTLDSIYSLGRLYQNQGRFAESAPYLREELAACRTKYGSEHEETLVSIYNLAIVCQSMGEFAQAEELATELCATRESVSGETDPQTRSAIELLVSLYESWDRADPGAGYDAKAASWRLRLLENGDGVDQG